MNNTEEHLEKGNIENDRRGEFRMCMMMMWCLMWCTYTFPDNRIIFFKLKFSPSFLLCFTFYSSFYHTVNCILIKHFLLFSTWYWLKINQLLLYSLASSFQFFLSFNLSESCAAAKTIEWQNVIVWNCLT